MKTIEALRAAMAEVEAYYKERGIFQDKFGFGISPALIVIDMAYGWTDPAYAGGSARLDSAIAAIQRLLPIARTQHCDDFGYRTCCVVIGERFAAPSRFEALHAVQRVPVNEPSVRFIVENFLDAEEVALDEDTIALFKVLRHGERISEQQHHECHGEAANPISEVIGNKQKHCVYERENFLVRIDSRPLKDQPRHIYENGEPGGENKIESISLFILSWNSIGAAKERQQRDEQWILQDAVEK